MRKLVFILCLSLALVACGDKSPKVKDTNGNQFKLSIYKGKWIFINYWANWCKPCIKEIPELNKFHQKHKNKDAVVLGVNYDAVSASKLQNLIKLLAIQYPVLAKDPAAQLKFGDIPGLPATYVIDPSGHFKQRLLGPQTEQELEAFLKRKT